jgi:flagellar biosynthesis protein FlhB
MAEAKIHPPSPSRVAEARAAGLAPVTTLVGVAGGVTALALAGRELLPRAWRSLGRLTELPLQALAQADVARAQQLARVQLVELAATLAWCALVVLLCVSVGLVVAQGFAFVWPRRARRPFTPAKPGYLAPVLWALALCLVLVASLPDAFWVTPAQLPALLTRFLGRLALAALGLSLVDAALGRERFFRSLWLTRREQRDEQREAFGAPEMRAARTDARHGQRSEPRPNGEVA